MISTVAGLILWLIWCVGIKMSFLDEEDEKRAKAYANHSDPPALELVGMCVMILIPALFFFLGFMAGRC